MNKKYEVALRALKAILNRQSQSKLQAEYKSAFADDWPEANHLAVARGKIACATKAAKK